MPTDKGAHAGRKIGSLVGGRVVGTDSIADLAVLRHGATGPVFDRPYARTFLREFTFGHVRHLDAVASRFLSNLCREDPAHHPALRQFVNRLVGFLHGFLKSRTIYDEASAWAHQAYKHLRRLTSKLLGCLVWKSPEKRG